MQPSAAAPVREVIRLDLDRSIEIGTRVVAEAYERGTQFTGGWPLCTPLLLARSAAFAGETDKALSYLMLAVDLANRADARGVLIEADQVCMDIGATVLRQRVQTILARQLPN